jgi:hypothetical protein
MKIPSGILAVGVLSFLAAAPAVGGVVQKLSFGQVVERGSTILVGTVVSSSTRWGEGHKMIWTDYEVSVEEVWKGSLPTRSVTLSFAGGTVDGKSILVTHVPRLEVGGTYVLSLNDLRRRFTSPVVGAEQGLFREVTDKTTGDRILLDAGGWAVGLGSSGDLTRLAPADFADAPDVVTLRRDAPRSAQSASERSAPRGIPGAVYSDGAGNPLPASASAPPLAAVASRGAATGGKPLTRAALRTAVRQALEPRERPVR